MKGESRHEVPLLAEELLVSDNCQKRVSWLLFKCVTPGSLTTLYWLSTYSRVQKHCCIGLNRLLKKKQRRTQYWVGLDMGEVEGMVNMKSTTYDEILKELVKN